MFVTVFNISLFNNTVNCGNWNLGENDHRLEKTLEHQVSSEHPEPNSAVGRCISSIDWTALVGSGCSEETGCCTVFSHWWWVLVSTDLPTLATTSSTYPSSRNNNILAVIYWITAVLLQIFRALVCRSSVRSLYHRLGADTVQFPLHRTLLWYISVSKVSIQYIYTSLTILSIVSNVSNAVMVKS